MIGYAPDAPARGIRWNGGLGFPELGPFDWLKSAP